MKILQLIDSLQPGGAEKMAVNYANELAKHVNKSYLLVTNKPGALINQVNSNVHIKVFNRNKLNAILVTIKILFFLKKNKIDVIQAHGSSYKWVKIVKFFFPDLSFYWHDHNGNRIKWNERANSKIIKASKYFTGSIACNLELYTWAENNLLNKKKIYVPNFIDEWEEEPKTFLKGKSEKRIVCLANLREPKNHAFLIKAFLKSNIAKQGWTMHLIGGFYNDLYYNEVVGLIKNQEKSCVYIYGTCTDVNHILKQAQIGVLVSSYEGFPVSLLEYGANGLCPIVSNVGYMPNLVNNLETGYLINNNDLEELVKVFTKLTESNKWKGFAEKFKEHIKSKYSAKDVVKNFLKQLNE